MPVPKAPRRSYTQEVLEEAIASVQDGMTVTAAAKHYNIPRQTLKDKISGRYATVCKMGRPSILTPEEEKVIVDWVISIGAAGFPVSKEQLLSSVHRLMSNLKRDNPFSGGAPGEKWLSLFTQRHPEISARVTQAITTSRANVTEADIRQWFGELRQYVVSKDLITVFDDPRRVFNCDETAFFLCPKGKKVFVKKGQKQVYTITGNDEKECLTVLFTANAAGELAPPMIVYSYERVPSYVVQQVPDKWGIGKSENGWMTGETFYEFVTNIFNPWLLEKQIPRPVVLFLDGHTSHLTLQVSEFCSNNEIELISLHPNSTHILQPIDVSVFHPLKATWRKTVDKWRFESGAAKIKKDDFAPLLKKSLEEGINPKTISSGFTTTGLASLDPDKIDFKKLVKSCKQVVEKPYTHSQWLVLRSHLTYLESKISKDKLKEFQEEEIKEEDTSLYKVWKEIKEELSLYKQILEGDEKMKKKGEMPVSEAPVDEAIVIAEGSEIREDIFLFNDFTYPIELEVPVVNVFEQSPTNNNKREISNDPMLGQTSDFDPFLNPKPQTSSADPSTFYIPDLPPSPSFSFSSPTTAFEMLSPSPLRPYDDSISASPNPPTTLTKNQPLTSSRSLQLVTPVKQQPTPKQIHDKVSTPFKKALFWPKENPKKSIKKKIPVKFPSAITSEEWKNYYLKKEEDKKKAEMEKEKRKQVREKKQKEKKEAENKKKGLKRKRIHKKEAEDDDPDDPDDLGVSILEEDTSLDEPLPVDPSNLRQSQCVVVPYNVNGEKNGMLDRLLT